LPAGQCLELKSFSFKSNALKVFFFAHFLGIFLFTRNFVKEHFGFSLCFTLGIFEVMLSLQIMALGLKLNIKGGLRKGCVNGVMNVKIIDYTQREKIKYTPQKI